MSTGRTGKGKVAVQYHTARFRLVPALAKALTVATLAVRKPGTLWIELPCPAAAGAEPAGHVRIGYARASTVRQSLDTQLDALQAAGVTRVFSEKISTRATTRPELDKAVTLARELRSAGVAVTLVVHEHSGSAAASRTTDKPVLHSPLHRRPKPRTAVYTTWEK